MADQRNVVYRSTLTGTFYFVARAKDMGHGVMCAVGRKHDITAALQPFLLKKFRIKAKGNGPATGTTGGHDGE